MGKSKTEFGLTNKKQFLRLAEARSVFGFRMGNKPKPTLQLAKVSLRRLGKKQIIGVSMSEAVNHESCPMTGSILSEKTDKSQDLNQPRIVSRELNFDFAQFFYPQEKRKIFKIRYFQSSITDKQGNTQNINAIVKPDATLGTLTTFDERVFYALIEIWQEQDKDDLYRIHLYNTRAGVATTETSLNRLG